jgi:hypothetical protein
VSESSVVPVSAGVRAGVAGVGGLRWSRSGIAVESVGPVVTPLASSLGSGLTGRIGVRTSSGLDEFSPRAVSTESARDLAGLLDVMVSPRFLEALGGLLSTPDGLRERGRAVIPRPSVSSLSLSWLDWAFHCFSRSAASAFSNYPSRGRQSPSYP